MPPARAPPPASPTSVQRSHTLSLLSEYTHTLDALPIDLARSLADLRELDAVSSPAVAELTHSIHALADAIEAGAIPDKEQRLWRLQQIADAAARLYTNSQDKIRVACLTGDTLRQDQAHLNALLAQIPALEDATVSRKTEYPHVALKHFPVPSGLEPKNPRRRGGVVSYVPPADPSPAKQRKRQRDEDGELVRPAKKEKTGDGAGPKRGAGGRAKKQQHDRGGSPTDSIMSVTSHIPQTTARTSAAARAAATKRARAQAAVAAANGNGHLDGPGLLPDLYNAAPSSSTAHPSLPTPSHAAGWGAANNQLEGPGMPVARAHIPLPPISAAKAAAAPLDDDGADEDRGADGDEDLTLYCFCQRVSFGEMVACDGTNCSYEWFHLPCVGIAEGSKIPDSWFCEECKTKMQRSAKRGGRGGKRRPAAKGRGGH